LSSLADFGREEPEHANAPLVGVTESRYSPL